MDTQSTLAQATLELAQAAAKLNRSNPPLAKLTEVEITIHTTTQGHDPRLFVASDGAVTIRGSENMRKSDSSAESISMTVITAKMTGLNVGLAVSGDGLVSIGPRAVGGGPKSSIMCTQVLMTIHATKLGAPRNVHVIVERDGKVYLLIFPATGHQYQWFAVPSSLIGGHGQHYCDPVTIVLHTANFTGFDVNLTITHNGGVSIAKISPPPKEACAVCAENDVDLVTCLTCALVVCKSDAKKHWTANQNHSIVMDKTGDSACCACAERTAKKQAATPTREQVLMRFAKKAASLKMEKLFALASSLHLKAEKALKNIPYSPTTSRLDLICQISSHLADTDQKIVLFVWAFLDEMETEMETKDK